MEVTPLGCLRLDTSQARPSIECEVLPCNSHTLSRGGKWRSNTGTHKYTVCMLQKDIQHYTWCAMMLWYYRMLVIQYTTKYICYYMLQDYDTIWCKMIWYYVLHDTINICTMHYDHMIQYDKIQLDTIQYDITWYRGRTRWYNMRQYSMIQYDTLECNVVHK